MVHEFTSGDLQIESVDDGLAFEGLKRHVGTLCKLQRPSDPG